MSLLKVIKWTNIFIHPPDQSNIADSLIIIFISPGLAI